METDVLCIGAAVVDIPLQPVDASIFNVESYPLDNIEMTLGGDALNQAIIISRLGYEVSLMSRLGEDVPGRFIRELCRKEKIFTNNLTMDKKINTSINVGLVTNDGERTFVTNRNGSLWKIDESDINYEFFKEAKLLSLGSIFNCPLLDGRILKKIFKKAKAVGLITCADFLKPRLNETLDDIKQVLSYVDYLFPNYEEASQLTGKKELRDIAKAFLDCGAKVVVIKNGKDGCYIKSVKKEIKVPAITGIEAVDTIGAGDNFVAGFITAILEGKSLLDCGRYANATASVAVQYVGATTGVTERAKVDVRFKEYDK